MTWFAAIALVLTAAALLCVIRPLLRQDVPPSAAPPQDAVNLGILRQQARDLDADLTAGALTAQAHGEARAELEQRVGDEVGQTARPQAAPPQRVAAGLAALLVPLVAAGLYWYAGNPAALAVMTGSAPPMQDGHQISAAQVSTLVQGLADRLRRQPADADGWYMLARSYTAIGRHHDAVQAYERLVALVADDPDVLADYADAVATAQGGTLQGRPMEIVRQALELAADHPKALALAGSGAYERGDFQAAAGWWKRMLPALGGDAALRAATESNIAAARQRAGESLPAASLADKPAAPAPDHAVSGTVTIAPELLKHVAPGATVFVFARAVDGPPLPLAVLRRPAGIWPFAFRLDDTMSMTPEARLSSANEVTIGVRVSAGRSATPAAGDLEGRSAPLRPGTGGIVLNIDTRRP